MHLEELMAIQSGGINIGSGGYFDTDSTNWNFLGTVGDRHYEETISFPTEFANAPIVVTTLRGFHIQEGENSRLAIGVTGTTTTGFILNIDTWGDTSVVGLGVNWIAYDSVLDGI